MNILERVDSYKFSHWNQYPPGTQYLNAYIEARCVPEGWDENIYFTGIYDFVYSHQTLTLSWEDVDRICLAYLAEQHGVAANREALHALRKCKQLPLKIEAKEEGINKTRTALVQIQNTAPEFYWLVPYIETQLLRAIWYPSTVATLSMNIKNILREGMEKSCDSLDGLEYKLHNFGSRGASSHESDVISGIAHCLQFKGTDSFASICSTKDTHRLKFIPQSIPAMEHSTVITWGQENEFAAYSNMMDKYLFAGKKIACVIDSYDVYAALTNFWCTLEVIERVRSSGGTVVLRLDSGNPIIQIDKVLQILLRYYGCCINTKSFFVLPDCIRVLWGDGLDFQAIKNIVDMMIANKYSLDNIAFGMGGALTQGVTRDTLGFSFKVSAIDKGNGWEGCKKRPLTDLKKESLMGVQEGLKTLFEGRPLKLWTQ